MLSPRVSHFRLDENGTETEINEEVQKTDRCNETETEELKHPSA
jgi:hypothetical protein